VHEDDETNIAREIEDAIESRVGKTGRAPSDLGGDELLMDGELTDSGKDTGIDLEYASNVIDRVHVGRLNPVIMGSKRAWSRGGNERKAFAM
jgi:hypothetical protein